MLYIGVDAVTIGSIIVGVVAFIVLITLFIIILLKYKRSRYEKAKLIILIFQSTITKKMAAVHYPINALWSKIFKSANGCLLKDRPKAGGRFVYSAKISHH